MMHNARIVQREDLEFDLIWEDGEGATQTAGPFMNADVAASDLGNRRADAEAAKSGTDGP
jgi:hypothetical protein